MVKTMTRAGILATQDREATTAIIDVVKNGFTEALKDESFIKTMVTTGSGACIQASQDEALKNTVLEVVKEAVTDALRDEAFMKAFRTAMQDSLKDHGLYRAAAGGVVNALNPFRRCTQEDSQQQPRQEINQSSCPWL